MATMPGKKKINKFSKEWRGSFGRFQTDASFSLQFLSTTMQISHIGDLKTAGEMFDVDSTNFEELIQRDIDHVRVEKIAKEYLAAGKGRVIFFPPLLVCVAVLNSDGSLKSNYGLPVEETVVEGDSIAMVTTYDGDAFQSVLYQADEGHSTRTIDWGGQEQWFFDFGAGLRINPARTALVVLDGQHRLEAIRLLMKTAEAQKVIEKIELPVCIVWPPRATEGVESESVTKDFRQLFVTVNSEPQKVSGHFILLLRDTSYASMAIRALAEAWKDDRVNGWSRLHLLEWNTREDQRVDQRTRNFSVTTVSIVAKALKEHLFEGYVAAKLLRLDERGAELQAADPSFSPSGMRDATRNVPIDAIVKQQITAHLVPALTHLLRRFKPYAEVEVAVGQAFMKLETLRQDLKPAYIAADRYLSQFVYNEGDIQEATVKAVYAEFRNWILIPADNRVFLYAVFQQALLRFWLRTCHTFVGYDLSALQAAESVTAGLETFTARSQRGVSPYLDSDQLYTRRVLWREDAVNYGPEWARNAWFDINQATLSRNDVVEAMISVVAQSLSTEQISSLRDDLRQRGLKSARAYANTLGKQIEREILNNLADFFGEAHAGVLREMKQKNKADFDQAIREKLRARYSDALNAFADALQIDVDSIDSHDEE
jgi:hypothetical protein